MFYEGTDLIIGLSLLLLLCYVASPGDLPAPGIEPGSPALEADALTSEPPGKPGHTAYIM